MWTFMRPSSCAFRNHVRRVRLMLVVLGGDRADLPLGELVRQRPQVALLVDQGERDPACSGLFGDRHRCSTRGSMQSASGERLLGFLARRCVPVYASGTVFSHTARLQEEGAQRREAARGARLRRA